MTKVLFFEVDDTFGGIESFLLNMVENANLRNSDIQFDFVTCVPEPAGNDKFVAAGVNMIHISGKKKFLQYYKDLNKLFRDREYGVVHIQKNSLSNAIPVLIARKYHVPYILHAQNSAPSKSNIVINALHYFNRALVAKHADIKLACGTVAAKWMFKTTDGVKIVKNGINPDDFKRSSEIRAQLRAQYKGSNDIVFCNVGRFTDQKNHRFMIEIFREIHKLNANTKLFLVGDGINMNQTRKKVKEYGLENSVVFFGSLDRTKESKVLMASDVFLMPSLYEGVSIASVEAQMAGLQLFVSDTVDTDTNITGNVTFLSLQKSAKEWAEEILKDTATLQRKYDYRSLLARIQSAGYDMKQTTMNLIKIYKECRKGRK